MPGKIKVKILAGRNLPVMDRSGDTTDAYVEIKFGNTTYKTDVCRKSLNPQWNSEWYRFEVDDAELQDEPLQVRLMDHDTYSANDAIGKVYVNLNPLLLPGLPPTVKNIWTLEATMNSSSGAQGGSVMTGWIPVFDTMHGIRGEVNIIVKVELFSDCNKFRQSSCGVQFFYSPNIPHGYHAQVIHGFVEELVVSDDPEYKWIDKIRTPRASNEARQTLFFKLSGEVQRKIGLKALDLGGNAVIGYIQNFDLEGESGIVARGIGTAVTLVKLQDISSIFPLEGSNIEDLTCFDLQSKNQLDLSESDDSLPLLSHSPNQSPISRSPTNFHTTTVSPRFPRYEKNRKNPRHPVRVAEYRAAGLRARQLSLQHNVAANSPMRKGIGSSLSLADDLINESSLRNMLALEDMRGEPLGNPFSRGLKNFRYLHQNILPRRVAQIKSKISDSFDDESDPESTYSSTWSLAGSESNRSSSIVDIRQSIRKKKFTHKKSVNDGIAALLIRSVHSGFPLDSVREDRETPTPSPVNFLSNMTEYSDESNRRGDVVEKNVEEFVGKNVRSIVSQLDENSTENEILVGKNKHDVKYTADELLIPMISSSETDTSSSDEDEPSESSTNYNILDDRYSLLMDPSSNDDTPNQSNVRSTTTKDAKLSEISEKIKPLSEKPESTTIYNENEENSSTVLEPNCTLESSTDYNILDDFNSLAEHGSIDDIKLELTSHRDAGIVKLLETINGIEETFDNDESIDASRANEKNLIPRSRTNDSYVDIFNDDEKFQPSSQRAIEVTKLSEPSITVPLDTSSQFERADDRSKNVEDVENSETKHAQPNTLRDCHSTSSTNYYFLDESYHTNENNSVDDAKLGSNIREPILDESYPEISVGSVTKMATSDFLTIEERSPKGKEITDESVFDVKLVSSSRDHDVLESSTDHNMLDDTWSLTEPNSTNDYQQRNFETEPFSTISNTFASISTLEQFREFPTIQPTTQTLENPTDDKNVSSTTFHAIPLLSKLDASPFVHTAVKSTSSGPESSPSTTPTKLKHLKFLPKQKHFDSAEDLGFVTSTPVETDVALFPEFETNQKSPIKSLESPKFDFKPSTASFFVEKSDVENPKFETSNKPSHVNSSRGESKNACYKEKIVQLAEKQICPLGISFDTTRIVNETKTTEISVPVEISKIDAIHGESSIKIKEQSRDCQIVTVEMENPSAKKVKPVKKIERTDTVIYKGPAKNRERAVVENRDGTRRSVRSVKRGTEPTSPIPIVVAPPPEDHATRLQVPVIQTTNINVQSTFSPDEMKTQQFGSIGNRKFPIDERAINDRFNRKYRQHCMLDLIRTIDAKMMIHHGHHDRRDSTKSKRKKRERINASATPSPDSIRRLRSHRRRSKSRSPDKQQTGHPKNQVSSLFTHSFPNSPIANVGQSSNPNFSPDSTSGNSSCENIFKNPTGSTIPNPSKDHSGSTAKDNISFTTNISNKNSQNNIKLGGAQFPVETSHENNLADIKNNELESNARVETIDDTEDITNDPKESERPVDDRKNPENLERPSERISLTTKTTNTANTIDDLRVPCSPLTLRQDDEQQPGSPVQTSTALSTSVGSKVAPNATATTRTNAAVPNMNRRSSDSDLSITPKGNSLAGSDRSMGGHMRPSTAIVRTMNQDAMEMLEYPFITMQQYPPGFVLTVGGLVSARSVKLLERITNLEEPESRDAWWTEIRMEVRSHARALACNVVLGYKEEISICDDVCVLNASGTAAVINLLNANQDQDNVMLGRNLMTTSVESEREKIQMKSSIARSDKSEETSLSGQQTHGSGKVKRTSESNDHEISYLPTLSACSLCHLPYNEASVPFRVDVSKCAICRRAKVPDVLFTTIELPENIPMTGRGVFVQATVCKSKRDLRGELNAKEISDCLPFLEYELHSLLLNKLKVKGMNAIFGLKVQVSVGERLVIGMAVGTAVYLTALPTPSVPQIASGNAWHNEEQLAEIQKTLIDTVKKNREFYRLKPIIDIENGRSITTSDTDESDDDLPDLDLGTGTKDACVLEVDDVEDMDRINLLIDERPPDDFHVVNTQMIPGLEDLEIVRNLQMFTQISRTKIPSGQFASMPSKYFARMLQTVLFKLRRMVPCALCDMQFKIALPEQDEIQLSVVGMALGLGEPTRLSKYKRKLVPNSTSKDPIKKTEDNDMIFSLEEDQADTTTGSQDSCPAPNHSNPSIASSSPLPGATAQKHRPRSPFRTKPHVTHRHKHVPLKERYGVDITPLSYLPGGKIERYLGNINFFFIRESTSIRENGGLSGFTHSFVTEILAIVRAHITALGGDAMVAFFMTQCVLLHSPHKNQGQCLINVGGDVVTVSYENDKYQGNQNC